MNKKIIAVVFLLPLAFFACKMNTPGVSLITGDFTPPKLTSIEVLNENEISLDFSKPVEVAQMTVCLAGQEGVPAAAEVRENNAVMVTLPQSGEIGKKYVLQGTVTDGNGNALSFVTEFTGFNARVPKLILSEVRVDYAKPKVEFIELYAQSSGNIGGVTVFNSHNGDPATYEFPPAEVSAGEYIVLHLRSIEEGLIDESGALDVSAGTEAFPYARDFWEQNTSSRLSKNCVILLMERKNGRLIDALPLTEAKNTAWIKPAHADAAKLAFESGVWLGGAEPEHAVASDGITATRTLNRQGNLQNAGPASKTDWLIVATGCASPGSENSGKPYIPK